MRGRIIPVLALALCAAPAVAQTDIVYPPTQPQAYYLADVNLTQTAIVAIGLGPRQLTVSTNCIVGDRLIMVPAATMPAGYMLGDAFCSANGTALVTLYAPLLAIGGSYTITAKIIAFR